MMAGFSADHARILMCSNSQAPLHTYTHMGLHALAQRHEFPTLMQGHQSEQGDDWQPMQNADGKQLFSWNSQKFGWVWEREVKT